MQIMLSQQYVCGIDHITAAGADSSSSNSAVRNKKDATLAGRKL
jgi:hypothetical protein